MTDGEKLQVIIDELNTACEVYTELFNAGYDECADIAMAIRLTMHKINNITGEFIFEKALMTSEGN